MKKKLKISNFMKEQEKPNTLWSQLNSGMWVFDNGQVRAILSPEDYDPHGYKLSIKIKMLHGTTNKYYYALSIDQAQDLAIKHICEHLEQKANELKELSNEFYENILWKLKS